MTTPTQPNKLNPLAPYEYARKEFAKKVFEIAGKEANPRIVWYHSFTTLRATSDEVAWCSAFVCACAEASGFRSTRSAAAKSWETYGVPGTGKKGDLAIFKRKDASNPNARHVAFVDSDVGEKDTLILCLGGNQGNKVSQAKYKREDLVCFRRFPG